MAATTSPRDSKPCALLELPAELRNCIYRYALCEQERITIDRDAFQQPELLKTCRKVRQEASAIYYFENKFNIEARNFHSSVAVSWWQHAGTYYGAELDGVSVQLGTVASRRSWSNLMRWVKLKVVDEKCFGLNQFDGGTPSWPSWNVAAGAMQIAQGLHDAGTSWVEIVKALEIYKVGTKYTVDWED